MSKEPQNDETSQAWRGARLVAAVLALHPALNTGWRWLPRTCRALKGWRLLCPSYSRAPLPRVG